MVILSYVSAVPKHRLHAINRRSVHRNDCNGPRGESTACMQSVLLRGTEGRLNGAIGTVENERTEVERCVHFTFSTVQYVCVRYISKRSTVHRFVRQQYANCSSPPGSALRIARSLGRSMSWTNKKTGQQFVGRETVIC